MSKLPLLLVLAALACNSRTTVARQAERATELRGIMERFHASSLFPGGVIGAWFADDSTTVVEAVGVADRAAEAPIEPDARLHAGSAGKMFFAALALQLVGEGRLQLDDPVSRHLGHEAWYARLPNGNDITIRMLLDHTAGLPEYGRDFMVGLIREPSRERTPLDAVKSVLGANPAGKAGAAYRYSDVNYQVLQLVMERVTRTPASAEIERRFIKPLNLTSIVPADQRVIPGLVPGYAGRESFMGFDRVMTGDTLIMHPAFEGGGGGFVSNPGDLARWTALFAEGKVFPESLLTAVRRGVPAGQLDVGAPAISGLGIEIATTPIGLAYGHGGFFPGYLTLALWYPDRGVAVAIQVNSSAPDALGKPLRDVLLEAAQALTDTVTKK